MPPSSADASPDRTLALIVRRFFSTLFLFRCPVCARGGVARDRYRLRERCGSCGARFERPDAGNWMVAATLNYFFNALICVAVAFTLVRQYGFFTGLTALMIGVACATALLVYWPSKVLGLWVLWVFGFVEAD